MSKNPYSTYQKANETVSEIKQVIMLYEGAINYIEQAKAAMDEGKAESRYNLINKAIAIVSGLNSCLEFNEDTEEVANALDQYYQSLDTRLLFLLGENNTDECDIIIDDLKVMLEAWRDIEVGDHQPKEEQSEQNKISEEITEEKQPVYQDLSELQNIELNI